MARSRVIGRFTLDSVVARYEALYETVLAKKTAERLPLEIRQHQPVERHVVKK
jgi:hypothetical protein